MTLNKSKDVRSSQEKLLTSWIKLSQEMTAQMSKSIETGGEEFKEMRNSWFNLLTNMEKLASKIQESDPDMAESVKTWSETTKKLNDEFLTQMDSDLEEMTRRSNSWLHTMSDMSTSFVKAMWEINLKMLDTGVKGAGKRGGV
jgi:hypothetical protein